MKKVISIFMLLLLIGFVNSFEFCSDEINGQKELRIISLSDMLIENNKEWNWEVNQHIEVEVRVWNLKSSSEKYILEMGFLKNGELSNITENINDLSKEFILGADERRSVSFEFKIDKDIEFDDYQLIVKFYKKGSEDSFCVQNNEIVLNLNYPSVCNKENIEVEDLNIISISDKNLAKLGSWNWKPYDEIGIDVKIENNNYNENLFVELVLLDENKKDINFTKDSVIKKITLEKGNSTTINFNFLLNSDLSSGNYELYSKVYNNNDCQSLKAKTKTSPIYVNVEKNENDVIIKKVYGNSNSFFGKTEKYILTIVNLGDSEKKVGVIAYNYFLNLSSVIEIENMSSGEIRNVSVDIPIPLNLNLSRVKIEFSTKFDYDEKNNIYKKYSSEDDDISYFLTITNSSLINSNNISKDKNITREEISIPLDIEKGSNNFTNESQYYLDKNEKSLKYLWIIVCIFVFCLIIFIILLFFRNKNQKIKYINKPIVEPKIVRRYTASLH